MLDVPNVLEAEPNNEMDNATKAELPAALCGVMGEAGDVDRFRFAAKKGEVWDFNLVAREIRSPLDATLQLRKADGAVIAAADDNGGKPDSYFRFTIPEDGEYVAEVEDHLRQGGPTYLYRLEVTKPRAGGRLVAGRAGPVRGDRSRRAARQSRGGDGRGQSRRHGRRA